MGALYTPQQGTNIHGGDQGISEIISKRVEGKRRGKEKGEKVSDGFAQGYQNNRLISINLKNLFFVTKFKQKFH